MSLLTELKKLGSAGFYKDATPPGAWRTDLHSVWMVTQLWKSREIGNLSSSGRHLPADTESLVVDRTERSGPLGNLHSPQLCQERAI